MTSTAAAEVMSDLTSGIMTTLPPLNDNWQQTVLWMLIVGFIIAFILAFAVGANDVANSFGTTVGAGTLSLKQGCILASIFETLGAILLGAKVGTTIRKGIIDVEIYHDSASLLMVGEISAMLASGLWQLIATFLKLPVSGTHSIVGATVGFSLVAKGSLGVNWQKMGLIVGSWFLSPVLAGLASAGFYFLLRLLIFQKDDPVRPGLIALPLMYSFTIAINCFSVFYSGAPLLGFNQLSPVADILLSLLIGVLVALLVHFVVVSKLKKKFKSHADESKSTLAISHPSQAPAKKVKVLETINERESPEGSSTKLQQNGEDKCNKSHTLMKSSVHTSGDHLPTLSNDVNGMESQKSKRIRVRSLQSTAPSTMEEAKLLRQQSSKRSKSASQYSTPSVRIPAVLQLEKNVLKAQLPVPSAKQIKQEIRRNFSEPTMISLTQNSDADVYEVFINRQKKMVTIQRKPSSNSESHHFSNYHHHMADSKTHTSEQELEKLLSSIPQDMKLDEPFDDSDEEHGLTMAPPQSSDAMVGKLYSGAIEEGFRMLSTSQQNIIAIKVGEDGEDRNEELSKDEIMEAKEGRVEIRKMFGFLQILTACFGSFAHGGNDVSNAIGPLIAIWIIYNEGAVQQKSSTPLWILLYGGVGICIGLWVWGRRVIKTMGNDLTNLTPSRGFAIELMSALTVLMASNNGLPVSTTHCKVGAVVAVGWVRARNAVDWKIFRNIVFAWFVTVPLSGSLSALIFAIVRAAAGLQGA